MQRNRLAPVLLNFDDLFLGHVEFFGELDRGRLAAEVLKHLTLNPRELVDHFDHVHGDSNGARLIGHGAGDRLPNPPCGVRGELEALREVEFFDGANQPQVALLDEVEEKHAAARVALGQGNHQAEVGFKKVVLRLLPVARNELEFAHVHAVLGLVERAGFENVLGVKPGFDAPGEFHFLFGVEERNLADLLEIVLDGVGRGARHVDPDGGFVGLVRVLHRESALGGGDRVLRQVPPAGALRSVLVLGAFPFFVRVGVSIDFLRVRRILQFVGVPVEIVHIDVGIDARALRCARLLLGVLAFVGPLRRRLLLRGGLFRLLGGLCRGFRLGGLRLGGLLVRGALPGGLFIGLGLRSRGFLGRGLLRGSLRSRLLGRGLLRLRFLRRRLLGVLLAVLFLRFLRAVLALGCLGVRFLRRRLLGGGLCALLSGLRLLRGRLFRGGFLLGGLAGLFPLGGRRFLALGRLRLARGWPLGAVLALRLRSRLVLGCLCGYRCHVGPFT